MSEGRVSCTSHNIQIVLLLQRNKFCKKLWVVGEVGVHNKDKVAGGVLDAVHVPRLAMVVVVVVGMVAIMR